MKNMPSFEVSIHKNYTPTLYDFKKTYAKEMRLKVASLLH